VDTYFGRKFFYKSQTGKPQSFSTSRPHRLSDTLNTDNVSLYPQVGTACALLDNLASTGPNQFAP